MTKVTVSEETRRRTKERLIRALIVHRDRWLDQWQQLVVESPEPLRIDEDGLWQCSDHLLGVDDAGATCMTEHSMEGCEPTSTWLHSFWSLMASNIGGIYIIDGTLLLGAVELPLDPLE
jgi:hypothetical protein